MSMTTPQGGANYQQGAGSGLITAVTPTQGARIPFPSGLARIPETKTQSESGLTQAYRNMSASMRQALAQQLKDAGYKNPVTGKFSIKVRDAFLQANRDLNDEIKSRFQNDPSYFDNNSYDLSTFLKEMGNAGAGDKDPSVVRRRTELRPETIDNVIIAAFQDLVGRGPSQEELDKYRTKAVKKSERPSAMGETVYRNLPGGVQEQITREAFDPKQFLYSQIAKTDEAKANKIFSFYDAFKKALGV